MASGSAMRAGFVAAAAALLLLLAPLASAKEFVVTLTAKNFDEVVEKSDFIVVEFYAPWCGHCKSLAPEYEKAAKALSEQNIPVVLAKVDADSGENKPLAQRFEVQGFPTLKIIRKGDWQKAQDFKGPREADGIVSYLKKMAGPASSEIDSGADITELLQEDSLAIVGVFPSADAPELQTYLSVAEDLRSEFSFRHTFDASLLPVEHARLEKTPAVRLLTTWDDGFLDTTDFETESLKHFILDNTLPAVVEFTQDPKDRTFLNRAFESSNNKSLLFFPYNLTNAAEWREEYLKIAKTKPVGLTFLIGEDSQNEHALKFFGIDMSETPAIIVHDPKAQSKYFRKSIDIAGMKDFFEKFLAGEEEKQLKSQAVPEKNDDGVKVVVGKTFKEMVLDAKESVFIEFYAPWCGHCKKLDPIFKQVAAAFKNDKDVVIAKLDYTENDLPSGSTEFAVEGFPTLYFYTSTKKVIPYKGDRSKKDLIAFVKHQLEVLKAGNATEGEPEEEEGAEEGAEDGDEGAKGHDEL